MRVSISVILLIFLISTGCNIPPYTSPKPEVAQLASSIEKRTVRVKTSEDQRQRLSKDYNETVMLSILDLDDGQTSPEIIARAALSRAGDRYKAWKRATVGEDLNLQSAFERNQFETALNKFPTQDTIDMWTGFVLEFRRKGQKITEEGRARLNELGID